MKEKSNVLFDVEPDWRHIWRGMPEYRQENMKSWRSVLVHFETQEDLQEFAQLVKQRLTERTKSMWFPAADLDSIKHKRYVTSKPCVPRYPVYIISKGRWERPLTARALERMNIPYHIVIEPQEQANYAKVIDPNRLLCLPFQNLGQGSIPARNWVWEHAIAQGVDRHWILNDNIDGFCRLHWNRKIKVETGAIFRATEDLVDRYENVALAGFHYRFFAEQRSRKPALTLNTRVYSCILILNSLSYRWRGRYNEDTDLSLRVLKDGWCTMLLSAFLVNKMATMTMTGGNTDELYQNDGRLKMAESLKKQHPDVVRISRKWGRWQHHVDYRPFRRNALRLKDGVVIPEYEINNYGMYMVHSS